MKTRINLLPAYDIRRQVLRRRLVQWSSLISAVLLAGWAWQWFELREHRSLAQQLEVLEREHAPTQRMVRQLIEMRGQLEQLQHQESVARELEYQRGALTLLGVISQTARDARGRVRLLKLELTNFQHMDPSGTAGDIGAALLLSGVSLDNPAVGELLEGLQDSGIFRRVELLALTERQEANTSLRDYQVRCDF
jgi:hypothetical protein